MDELEPLHADRTNIYVFTNMEAEGEGLPSVYFFAVLLYLSVLPFGVGGLMWF